MMKPVFFAAALMSALTLCAKPEAKAARLMPAPAATEAAAATNDGWLVDYEAGLAKAKQTNRPVFLQFTGSDWCGWCMMMDRSVFSQEAWKTYAAEKLVAVKLDFPRGRNKDTVTPEREAVNRELMKKFGVRGYPTYLVLDASGREIGRLGAARGATPESFIGKLDGVLKKAAAAAKAAEAAAVPMKDADGWMLDFEAAKAQAKAQKRPLFLQFTGSDWCGWCIMMDRDVFATDAWKAYAAKHLVTVKADFPARRKISDAQKKKNHSLRTQFNVNGFPTYLIFDAEGNQIGELGASRGSTPESFIKKLEAVLKK